MFSTFTLILFTSSLLFGNFPIPFKIGSADSDAVPKRYCVTIIQCSSFFNSKNIGNVERNVKSPCKDLKENLWPDENLPFPVMMLSQ